MWILDCVVYYVKGWFVNVSRCRSSYKKANCMNNSGVAPFYMVGGAITNISFFIAIIGSKNISKRDMALK